MTTSGDACLADQFTRCLEWYKPLVTPNSGATIYPTLYFLSSPLSSSLHPVHWFPLISRGGGLIQSLSNGIFWYVAPVVAGWEATVYTVFRPITLTSQPTHKESFEQPVFGGIRWAFLSHNSRVDSGTGDRHVYQTLHRLSEGDYVCHFE